MFLPILALAIAGFGIGTTEYVVMGLLPDVARDLSIDAPRAGSLITGYALGVAVGAPILVMVTLRWRRRQALLNLMAMFIVGNAFCALASSYEILLVARVTTAFCHAAFFGIGSVVAASLAPPGKRAQAVALMGTGLTVANVLGVPFGTMLGHAYGWRMAFWAVVIIGFVALVALHAFLPRNMADADGNIFHQFRALLRTQVLIAFLISMLFSTGLFTVFTYIAFLLHDVTGLSAGDVSLALVLFGIGITIGGLVGGRLADWKQTPALIGLFTCNAAILILFTQGIHYKFTALLALFFWGVFAFAIAPSAQTRVIQSAKSAPELTSTINQGVFNLGNAIGAWLGGSALALSLPLAKLPQVGATVAIVALVVVLLAMRFERCDARTGGVMAG